MKYFSSISAVNPHGLIGLVQRLFSQPVRQVNCECLTTQHAIFGKNTEVFKNLQLLNIRTESTTQTIKKLITFFAEVNLKYISRNACLDIINFR